MKDNSRTLAATVVGAIVGGMAGYLFFSEPGRALRRRLEPALDDLSVELKQFGRTMTKAADVAGHGWKLLNEALGDREAQRPRYPTSHQTSPF